IIAIHGLDGHPQKSWTAPNGTLWLSDLLPEKLPQAHILTYSYDAYTRGGEQLTDESVYALAQKLLVDIATERHDSNAQRRPIIFVAHSLGGIVLKYALIHADRHEYSPYKAVERSTYGILFLGTPHQGSATVDLATSILQILSIRFDTNNTILNDLGLHSKALQQQQDQY
ncbi:hypothetical protein PILCRDRAFT_37074, partial [Piloderma croceum F 1598]